MEKEKISLKTMLAILFVVLVMGCTFLAVYHFTTSIIVAYNVDTMMEINRHDNTAINSLVSVRASELESAANSVRQAKPQTQAELYDCLAQANTQIASRRVMLIDTEGNIYSSSGVTTVDEGIRNLAEKNPDGFVSRYDSAGFGGLVAESRRELLMFGCPVRDFSVDGHTMCYALADYHLGLFENELKIDSFGGKGYSIVLDQDGYYIVSPEAASTLQSKQSFFERYSDIIPAGFGSIEEFYSAIADGEVQTTFRQDGQTYILVASSIPSYGWKLVSICPKETFQKLSNQVTLVFSILAAVMIIAMATALFLILRNRAQREKARMDEAHRKELAQALTMAQSASRAKTTFLNNMSHDIRTPMNAIVGFTNLAITNINHPEQVAEYLKKIQTSGNHLLSLINDILDMSHIESGKIHLEEKLCSLPEILHGLRNILQADIHAKQLELQIDTVDVVDEAIYCDKLRLNQVLLNLLSNAVKYTGAGGHVSMRITERPGAPTGYANYEFSIKDSGIGMSPEFVEHIFEPFERERNSTISKIQGTGLGMAITKNIVDMMNGSITVTSEQGVGTEFTVSFTFRLHAEKKEDLILPELKDCKALVVDDDFNTCDSVSYMLGQLGLQAEWTLSGKEAVLRSHQAVMRGTSYSVYIVDWLLPDMNGVEVTRRIRKETGENVPIIVLTAYDWSDIETEAKEAGVTAFCNKPLFLSELSACLQSVLRPKTQEDEAVTEEVRPRHTGRLLLAEDVEMNQELAVELLENAGFSVDVADNGQVAFDLLAKSEPGYYQAVLMDVQMPVMDGYEATKKIRKLENHELASIPIIAMTANAFTEDREEALKSGMNGHIAKPIDVQVLFQTLDNIL